MGVEASLTGSSSTNTLSKVYTHDKINDIAQIFAKSLEFYSPEMQAQIKEDIVQFLLAKSPVFRSNILNNGYGETKINAPFRNDSIRIVGVDSDDTNRYDYMFLSASGFYNDDLAYASRIKLYPKSLTIQGANKDMIIYSKDDDLLCFRRLNPNLCAVLISQDEITFNLPVKFNAGVEPSGDNSVSLQIHTLSTSFNVDYNCVIESLGVVNNCTSLIFTDRTDSNNTLTVDLTGEFPIDLSQFSGKPVQITTTETNVGYGVDVTLFLKKQE